ncbi:glutamate-5-semialdehyde dehydrogenase [Chitinophaga terrae (ex Kim and Jung 2007)]|uniref:Gamma-glutamyl phosphate reductase n=1 Tax=Chitinophaga terrae (ex Kim and Jung 2007) TaxID=408074 RepID=A0A1H4GEP5_9BACT|nr:glutamate-5-semialdehyde dehydrogenase [Chitinophaga terrae (ex Kim and Jung 2007)]GEP93371.1 gamma-glutamyl phosphate reductase [Chitinophaga terrae (ex Kim and Jung 2007)]SEB08014.1 glutamate-5-semialdehyde dehydrogenase [Chitinophaga terrae (ex Kim and Jung 2007)]
METIQPLLAKAQQASVAVRTLPDAQKKALLLQLADVLVEHTSNIIAANKKDLDRMADEDPKKDRLLLTETRIRDLAGSLKDIAALPNPADVLLLERTLPNGLQVQKKSVPLGVVGVIYESRPNVTVDVAALCIRSGNGCVLRGGSDAFDTNTILVQLIQQTLKTFGVDENAVQLLPTDRNLVNELLNAVKYVDIIIPRGSEQLIEFVRANSKVPVIETGAGVCHTYIEKTADLEKGAAIVTNAKVSRPSVCNSLDTVLIDEAVAAPFLALLAPQLKQYEVEIFADEISYSLLQQLQYPYLTAAQPEDFGREFLSLKCSVKVVPGPDAALAHIRQYSSKHSEAIISNDPEISERFLNEVDAAAVYLNASTRFTDGGVFGLGAEIGISTQKLHARGPFALEKLVTEKWIIHGSGQVR